MEVSANTVDGLYHEVWNRIKVAGIEQNSRNGPVVSIPEPVLMTLRDPSQRVLMSPVRDANPFFHVAEVVWMLAGSADVKFVEKFNRRYREYADDNEDFVWGAYGDRWINHWDFDQIQMAIDRLKENPEDRQVVISMWNPIADLPPFPKHNDRPCNTQLMFRIVNDALHMLVVNRSNDMVWGALGANVVHFTYLQEVICRAVDVYTMGPYRVVTNNLHVYPEMPNYDKLFSDGCRANHQLELDSYPVLHDGETWDLLHKDCIRAIELVHAGAQGQLPRYEFTTQWMQWVAWPMMQAYLSGPASADRGEWILNVRDDSWRAAALAWQGRRAAAAEIQV